MPIEQDILKEVSGIGKVILDLVYGILGFIPQILNAFDTIAVGISAAMNISQYSKSISILLFGIASILVFIFSGSVKGRVRSGILLAILLAFFAIMIHLFL